jgi:uridylate kinase
LKSADAILKATKVDGVPQSDGRFTAERFSNYLQNVLERQLKVMDASAIYLCMDNNLTIIVFNMRQAGNIKSVVLGEPDVGTRVWLGR